MPFIGETAALVAALFWGGCAILFENAGKQIGAFVTNLIRILLACIFLSVTLFMQTGQIFPIHATSHEFFWLGLSGVIGLAIGDGALFYCLVILGPRRATLLLSMAPPITAFLAWIFLGEKLGILAILGIFITMGGVFWVVNEKHVAENTEGSKKLGIVLGIIAAVGQGIGLILAKIGLADNISPLAGTLLRMVPAAMVLWLVSFITGHFYDVILALRNKRAMLATFGGAIFGPYLGVWLSFVAVKYTEAGIAATLLATVPILIIPMIILVHKTRPSWRGVAGSIAATAGIALLFLR